MTLVNRVSLFFLVALAIVLASYSLLVYALVRHYLYSRFDEQLQSAFNALVAAIEVEPDDVKFEPTDHTIRLGSEADVDDIRWAIYDERDQLVASSRNFQEEQPAVRRLFREPLGDPNQAHTLDRWRLLQHRVAATAPKPVKERDPLERGALLMTVGRSEIDLQQSLRNMAWLATVLPLAVWTIAALLGRWYCGRALAPVQTMAAQARRMQTGGETQLRLAVDGTRDELSELAGAFNQLLDRLHGALERQTRFTGDAAHQLRTPLTILQGHIDVALRRPRAAAEYQETLALLGDETTSLSQLVESLLVLARSQEDAPLADVEKIVFDDWLPSYAERWQSHARWPDVNVATKAPRPVTTSPSLLAQLLDNLVSNAFKYSAPGSPVMIAATADGEGVVITVRDRGTGIAPAEQAMIFDPFFRSPAARQAGIAGTGLGLSLVKRLSETLGLTLYCHSEPGVGSTFSLHFPPGRI